MKKIFLFVYLSILCTIAQSQDTAESLNLKIEDSSFFYTGASISYISFHSNLNALVGYNFLLKRDAIALELETGLIFSANNEFMHRFTVKYYPSFITKPRHTGIIGVGVQSYGFTKRNNGIFSRFQDDYRQEMTYRVQSSLKNIFFVGGMRDRISDRLFYEVHAIIGFGDRYNEVLDLPSDAVYIGNGKFFDRGSLPDEYELKPIMNYRFLIAYRF